MSSMIQQYASFIKSLTYDQLPQDVIVAAENCILDCIGNMIYGRYSDMGNRALQYIDRFSANLSREEKAVIPGGEKYDLDSAAFAAAVMARCADLDDGHRYAMGHPGSVLVPAAMIYGQKCSSSGQKILTAIVAGYEVYTRLGAAINPTSYRDRGFDSTGVTGAVACTATLAKLFELGEDQIENALGIAALFASGLIEYQNDGSMGKVLCGTWAIDTAVKAVRLAQSGFTGATQALEGNKGFIQAFSNAPAPEKALEGLGQIYKIKEIYFKMYACMRGLHAAVDALLDIRNSSNIRAEDAECIEVHTTPFVGRLSKPHPTTEIGAQSSIEFALAVSMINGHIASEKVLVNALGQPETFALASKVKLVMEKEIDNYVKANPSHWGAVNIIIRTKDGRCCEQWSPLPRGEAENPFSWEQLREKFIHLAEGTPYMQYCDKLCAQIQKFDELAAPVSLLIPWNS